MKREEKKVKSNILENNGIKIVRGTYLTGVGQENATYYFKICENHSDFNEIQEGKVCVTFYQQDHLVTSIPALIRVGRVLTNESPIQEALKVEQRKGYPMLPIVKVIKKFDVLGFMDVVDVFSNYQSELFELQKSVVRKKRGKKSHEQNKFEQVNLF